MDLSLIGANIAKLWTNYWHIYLIEGVLTTLKLTIFAVVLGALLGIVVAMLKMSKNKIVRFLITVYIEVIRGTPLLLQLFLFYFVLPELLPVFDFNEFTWVAIALCINSSAYVSEIFRSGIQSVDKGQTEAARSLGLSSGQTMMRIVLPQAIKNILPALGNEFIMMLKETSLASTFFIGDLMTAHLKIKGATYLMLESLIITGIIYLCMTYPLSKLVEAFERKMKNAD
ncbi:MAG: amino acid ABC transporter permease [Oscillospiraceae bacterium]|nr:amino acid ABC transporter permease [Oscillospiraceae bacterium]MBP1553075.1 amino acid ABC transporter permease [Oscillospiraceae bacterium]